MGTTPIVATDLEGPVTVDDYAFEVAAEHLPDGDRAYSRLSSHCADLIEEYDLRPGNTLRFLPLFLKAHDVAADEVRAVQESAVQLTPRADEVYPDIEQWVGPENFAVVSTSYEHYVQAACDRTGLETDNVFATPFCYEEFELPWQMEATLLNMYQGLRNGAAVSELELLDTIDGTAAEELSEAITVCGGPGKVEAVEQMRGRDGEEYRTAFIGDSITDIDALAQTAERPADFAIAFNGNSYAIDNAEVVVVSETTEPLLDIVDTFLDGGRDAVIDRVAEGQWDTVSLGPAVTSVDDRLYEDSQQMRERVRSEAGALA